MKNSNDYFCHSDIGLCSLCVHLGHNVEFTEKLGKKGIFYFKRDQEIEKLSEAYWSRNPIPVVPAALFEITKHLKAMIESK